MSATSELTVQVARCNCDSGTFKYFSVDDQWPVAGCRHVHPLSREPMLCVFLGRVRRQVRQGVDCRGGLATKSSPDGSVKGA